MMSLNAHASRLTEKLATSFESGVPIFVLVDPVLGEPLRLQSSAPSDMREVERARNEAWGRETCRVQLGERIDLPLAQHPYVVALHGPGDPWLSATLEMSLDEHFQVRAEGLAGTGMGPMRVGGWLTSSMHTDDLCALLGELMQTKTEAVTHARYLRLADWRVLDWLTVIAGPVRIGAAMGRIQHWAYLDVLDELAVLKGDGPPARDLRFDKSAWMKLARGSLMHPTLSRWLAALSESKDKDWMPAATKDQLYDMAVGALDHAAEAAGKWPDRFKQPSDHTAWAALCLLHPGFAIEADVQLRMMRAADEDAANTVHAICMELDQLARAHGVSRLEENAS
jgi:hypothetical protein